MYHLCKKSRIYDGHPYRGPTGNGVSAQYETLEEAKKAQSDFNERNPVGWNIYDEETGKLIDGLIMCDSNLQQPVAEMSLAAFLRRLELEAKAKLYNGGAKKWLDEMLLNGLKVYEPSGQEALYEPFKEEAEANGMPVLVEVRCDTSLILMEDIFGNQGYERLEQFTVKREDVAAHFDYDHFPWEDESGASIYLPCNEHKKQAYINYHCAKNILKKRFKATPDGIAHQTTMEEIAQWIIDGEIKARSSKYTNAWLIDFVNWKDGLIMQHDNGCRPEFPTLNDCLTPCHFCEAELMQFEPIEWWLSYQQLTERWKNFDEPSIKSIITLYFKDIDIIVNNPRPCPYIEDLPIIEGRRKATLEQIKAAMYPLSMIKVIEEENGIKIC